jgi:hypothetical protein
MSGFDALDTDANGQLSKAELQASLPFPMWVLPIDSMIEVAKAASQGGESKLPMHEQVKDEGKLVQWQPGMRTIFFSHTVRVSGPPTLHLLSPTRPFPPPCELTRCTPTRSHSGWATRTRTRTETRRG